MPVNRSRIAGQPKSTEFERERRQFEVEFRDESRPEVYPAGERVYLGTASARTRLAWSCRRRGGAMQASGLACLHDLAPMVPPPHRHRPKHRRGPKMPSDQCRRVVEHTPDKIHNVSLSHAALALCLRRWCTTSTPCWTEQTQSWRPEEVPSPAKASPAPCPACTHPLPRRARRLNICVLGQPVAARRLMVALG